MKIVSIKQGSDEWLKFRRCHIGASDAPIIMGMSPWCSPVKLWEQKVFETEQIENKFMQRGKELEPLALKAFEFENDICMFPMVAIHDKIDWMTSSFDGVTLEKDKILEIKCPGKKDHAIALEGKIPPKYYPQLQHQIEVSGLEFSYYYSFDGKNGICLQVLRDQEFIGKMLEKEHEFWNCLKRLKPPKI